MAELITAPKGTYDILPSDQSLRRWVVGVAEGVFQRYGYRRIDTPLFEETRLFSRGLGGSTDIVRKEMYTFDDLGGRSMTLRPEGTAPVARAYVEHGMHTLAQPVKLYYYSPMFRYESPQSGRFRQHHQLGVEAIGSPLPEVDAETIGVLAAFYREIGLESLELRLNSMGCKECRPAYVEELRRFLGANANLLCKECTERAVGNPLRAFDCKMQQCRQIMEDAPRLPQFLCTGCAEHQKRVEEGLRVQGLSFALDHTLVRGMDYYTRTTFEFQSPLLGAQSGVGGGGRYDGLIEEIGGPPVPGVGFGTGVERILLGLARSEVKPPAESAPTVYLVAMAETARAEVFALAHEIRSGGGRAELDYMERSPKGQMKQAGRVGARYAFIVGEDELANGTVTVRNLGSGSETRLARSAAVEMALQEPAI
jgi:histidyl-tRNA synthetase